MDAQSQMDPAAGLLLKLRDFAKDLNDQERSLFAVLVGPGVQQLTGDLDEVAGFQPNQSDGTRLVARTTLFGCFKQRMANGRTARVTAR